MNDYTKSLPIMVANVKAKVKELRRDGTTGMSIANLRQIVSTKGITVAPAQFDSLLRDAIDQSRLTSYFYE